MENFLKCKIKNCNETLLPPNRRTAEREFAFHELKGFCRKDDWQPMSLEEQEAMMMKIRSRAES